MRYFLFVSIVIFWTGCAPRPYKDLKRKESNSSLLLPVNAYTPKFEKVLYNCHVRGKTPLGKRFSLSGLLFFKQFADGSERVVFQNQMGITYFDFGWDEAGHFRVHQIIAQMDKPALVKTLKKDIELLLFRNLSPVSSGVFTDETGKDYLRFELKEKGFVYYVFEKGNIVGIENADEKRKVVIMALSDTKGADPFAQKIFMKHLRANFTIDLNKITEDNNPETDATEE
ncbi:MAG: hypothetical protein EOP54_01730 [Sphingobacteriales bacterium]|nr:MAG: hypothetical protein EOP54_01730 [Sphingobacteriales bacterium]